jgi:hypothetical protein
MAMDGMNFSFAAAIQQKCSSEEMGESAQANYRLALGKLAQCSRSSFEQKRRRVQSLPSQVNDLTSCSCAARRV